MTKEEIEKEAEKRYQMSNRGLPMLSEEDYINEKSQDAFLAGFDFAQSQSNEQRYKEALKNLAKTASGKELRIIIEALDQK